MAVRFPAGAEQGFSQVEYFLPGAPKHKDFAYGDASFDLPPGAYDAALSNARVDGVPVREGMRTRLKAGLLKVNAGKDARVDVLDASKKALVWSYGTHVYGLPPGKYYVKVADGLREVAIEDGRLAEF